MVPTSVEAGRSASLLLLAKRCETEGPNYALDCAIEHLCDPARARILGNAKPYTVSLDAAVTLVPEGWCLETRFTCMGNWISSLFWCGHNLQVPHVQQQYGLDIKFGPMSICAAALRAHAALEESVPTQASATEGSDQ